jgi:hypothetical protein
MKKKIVTIILMIIAVPVLLSAVSAQPPSNETIVKAYAADTQYMPGQEGILYIAVLNYKSNPIEIDNITIYYAWFNYVKDEGWSGNDTIIPPSSEKTLSSNGGKFEREVGFRVPTDGRIISMSSSTYIIVYDKDGNVCASTDVYINVVVPTFHMTIQDMDKITTLFTILVVLSIVCTIIIAATIFLSARRPKVRWRPEEKAAE